MKVITLANQKGGVAKTTTAMALAYIGAHNGKRILLIDLDSQSNLTLSCTSDTSHKSSYELIERGERLDDCITPIRDNLDLVRGSLNLLSLKQFNGSTGRLKEALNGVKNYDLIIIDTPPSITEAFYNGIVASQEIIIPLQTDMYGVNAIAQFLKTFEMAKMYNPKIKIKGIVLTQYDARPNLNRQMHDAIIKYANSKKISFLGTIRKGVAIQEAISYQKDFVEYASGSKPMQDYEELYHAIIK